MICFKPKILLNGPLKDAAKGGNCSGNRDDVLAGIVRCYLEIDRPHTASSLAKARRVLANSRMLSKYTLHCEHILYD